MTDVKKFFPLAVHCMDPLYLHPREVWTGKFELTGNYSGPSEM